MPHLCGWPPWNFLDLSIRLVNGRLATKTFRKETAANTLLQADSHHPRSLIWEIPVGQFLRVQRNCSTEHDYRCESEQLYCRFRERGYYHRKLRRAKKITWRRSRVDLHQPCDKIKNLIDGPVRLITPFGVNSIILDHWHILTCSDALKEIVGERPLMVAKRVRNLDGTLVQS